MNKMSYKKAGVNIEKGNKCSRIAYSFAKKTSSNRKGKIGEPLILEGGFSGPIKLSLKDSRTKNIFIVKNSDGVGSKAVVAQKMEKFDSLAFDLIAMVADDCSALGAEPIAATNTLDMQKVDEQTVTELMKGIPKACKRAGISMIGGEIAELPDQVKGFTWNADLIGVVEESKLVDGSRIQKGDSVVAFKSNGFRSNGLTLARKILEKSFGVEWFDEKFHGKKWGSILLKPSLIVTPAVIEMVGAFGFKPKCEIHGLAHVTGGGISENLQRILKAENSIVLDNLFPPQKEFIELMQLGNVSIEESFHAWNMGNCFFVITPEPKKAIKIARKHGIKARIAGAIQ